VLTCSPRGGGAREGPIGAQRIAEVLGVDPGSLTG
jgi:hypothetical protein